ncbi:aminoglycoside phosphotransferase family protein [Nocardia sp. XZ_19_369]|uniref:aminoglycoside phosphotransferase family protein n=1 Tax=Nocardia sp. XZ_19_369 TaxID=2769487 RepID=UPI00188F451E|nr:aminoglycoside phosphotransferase family protein [Nocardia sp. XZ_19_369]
MPTSPDDLATAACAADVEINTILHQTDKTVLGKGTRAGQPVAVKFLLDTDPFWAAKWRHELEIYQVFARTPPPVRVPRLVDTDNARLMVLEWVDGTPVDTDRYPQQPITEHHAEMILSSVAALHRWQAPLKAFEVIFDYADRFRRYHTLGYLGDADHDVLQRLLATTGQPDQLNHGDPLASNILLDDRDQVTLLDWEFAGLFLPGFDLAMLHTQLGAHTPQIKSHIDTSVAEAGIETPFVLNLVTVLTRELRIHRELPENPLRATRLPLIETAWSQVQQRLHQLG